MYSFFKEANYKNVKGFFYVRDCLGGAAFHVDDRYDVYLLGASPGDHQVFLMLEFILICIFYNTIFKNPTIKYIQILSAFLFAAFCIFNYVESKPGEFDFIPLVVECLFFTIVILYYFYDTMRHNFTTPLFQLPSFWISVAFLIYFSGNFFLFLFSRSMQNETGFREQYTLIYSTMTIIKNVLLCTGIFVNKNLIVKKDNTLVPANLNLDNFTPS